MPEGCKYHPRYSTDIAAAWEVVEALIGLGYANWTMDFARGGYTLYAESGGSRGEGASTTAPHAICLAALKAVAQPA